MTYHDEDETDDAAGADDSEWPDASDMDDPDADEPGDEVELGTIDCPSCGKEIAEGSPRCPGCGNYISREDAPPARKPLWILAAVILCLLVILLASLR